MIWQQTDNKIMVPGTQKEKANHFLLLHNDKEIHILLNL